MKSVIFKVDCFDGKPRKKGERYFIEDHLANTHILAGRAVAFDANREPGKATTDEDKPEVVEEKEKMESTLTTVAKENDSKIAAAFKAAKEIITPKKKAAKPKKSRKAGG